MDADAALSAEARHTALSAIRGRVHKTIGSWVKDADAVQIAMATATLMPSDLLDFLFERNVARTAAKHASALRMTIGEWSTLFGSQAHALKTSDVNAVVGTEEFSKEVAPLQTALKLTIGETSMNTAWVRPWTRAAALLAMHMDESHEEFLASNLGGVVRADSRRLDDVRFKLSETGAEVMLLAQVVTSLANAVVTS